MILIHSGKHPSSNESHCHYRCDDGGGDDEKIKTSSFKSSTKQQPASSAIHNGTSLLVLLETRCRLHRPHSPTHNSSSVVVRREATRLINHLPSETKWLQLFATISSRAAWMAMRCGVVVTFLFSVVSPSGCTRKWERKIDGKIFGCENMQITNEWDHQPASASSLAYTHGRTD